MKRFINITSLVALTFTIASCSTDDTTTNNKTTQNNMNQTGETAETDKSTKNLAGTYIGYSWAKESEGVPLEESNKKIETTLELDENGTILDLNMDFLVQNDEGDWHKRNDTSGNIEVDFSVDPTISTPGKNYEAGNSMFTFNLKEMMSVYAVAVDEDNTVAYTYVNPINRYSYEAKFEPNFDFGAYTVGEMTINNGLIPTTRHSAEGRMKPESWDNISDVSMLDLDDYSYVMNIRGDYQGISNDTTIEELLILSGVQFVDGIPQPMDVTYNYHSNGGWVGNYHAVAQTLIGKNATELTTLIDYDKYADSVNENNFFGINTDTVSTATKSIQDSHDTISGATVRFSRENTSYQRALVDAGIINEKDVIKGRF